MDAAHKNQIVGLFSGLVAYASSENPDFDNIIARVEDLVSRMSGQGLLFLDDGSIFGVTADETINMGPYRVLGLKSTHSHTYIEVEEGTGNFWVVCEVLEGNHMCYELDLLTGELYNYQDNSVHFGTVFLSHGPQID